jgi:hypothetical protein
VIFFCCTSVDCLAVIRVTALDLEEFEHVIGQGSEWFPDKYPCPMCSERMAISTKCLEQNPKMYDLTPQEAFAAFSGAGMPSEQECSATRVRELLLTKRVVDVSARHIRGTNRSTLDRIELEDGIVLHLASSTHGACVYRIQVPFSFTEAVDEHHPAPQETP